MLGHASKATSLYVATTRITLNLLLKTVNNMGPTTTTAAAASSKRMLWIMKVIAFLENFPRMFLPWRTIVIHFSLSQQARPPKWHVAAEWMERTERRRSVSDSISVSIAAVVIFFGQPWEKIWKRESRRVSDMTPLPPPFPSSLSRDYFRHQCVFLSR